MRIKLAGLIPSGTWTKYDALSKEQDQRLYDLKYNPDQISWIDIGDLKSQIIDEFEKQKKRLLEMALSRAFELLNKQNVDGEMNKYDIDYK